MMAFCLTVQFYELLEGTQSGTAVDGFAGDGNALLYALLALLEYLNAEGGIGQHDVLLSG